MVQRVIGACNPELPPDPDQFIYSTCGGVAKLSGILNSDNHLLGSSSGPDDCIVGIMNSDTIGSNVCCYVSQQTCIEGQEFTYFEGGTYKETLHPQRSIKVENKR